MIRMFVFSIILMLGPFVFHGQKTLVIDGDKITLRDSLETNEILLTSVERGSQNQDAQWITYDRRPGRDPWNSVLEYLDENFTNYWLGHKIKILGVFVTYDDCMCFKTKTGNSPDMFLIHFKIQSGDWEKMKELYPGMIPYSKATK
jgi:hypothetical protein